MNRSIEKSPDDLLKEGDVARWTGLSIRTLQAYRVKGGGPVYIKLGGSAIRYRRSDVEAYIERGVRAHTSEPSE